MHTFCANEGTKTALLDTEEQMIFSNKTNVASCEEIKVFILKQNLKSSFKNLPLFSF